MIPYRAQQALNHVTQELAVLRGMLHVDTHELSGTVLLAGSGRSGTTWMSQIINRGNAYRDLFEPFHPQHVKEVADWPAIRYLPTGQVDSETADVVDALLAGRIRSRWTDRYNRQHLSHQRLIKAIRANLMLGYLRATRPQIKLIFVMRHPCAVAYSRMKLSWDTHLDQMLAQAALMHDHLDPYRETIERTQRSDNTWAKHIGMWCIENVVPLRELTSGDAHLLRYEELSSDFDHEVADLFDFLGRPIPTDIRQAARRRSAHFRRDSAIMRGGDLVGDWQRHVKPKHIDTMLDLLSRFGLSHLYNEKPMPRCGRDAIYIDPTPPLITSLYKGTA